MIHCCSAWKLSQKKCIILNERPPVSCLTVTALSIAFVSLIHNDFKTSFVSSEPLLKNLLRPQSNHLPNSSAYFDALCPGWLIHFRHPYPALIFSPLQSYLPDDLTWKEV